MISEKLANLENKTYDLLDLVKVLQDALNMDAEAIKETHHYGTLLDVILEKGLVLAHDIESLSHETR